MRYILKLQGGEFCLIALMVLHSAEAEGKSNQFLTRESYVSFSVKYFPTTLEDNQHDGLSPLNPTNSQLLGKIQRLKIIYTMAGKEWSMPQLLSPNPSCESSCKPHEAFIRPFLPTPGRCAYWEWVITAPPCSIPHDAPEAQGLWLSWRWHEFVYPVPYQVTLSSDWVTYWVF